MTWLFLVNFVFLQWFGIRLARIINVETNEQVGWDVIAIVIPMTGWWGKYQWFWRIRG